MIEDNHLRHHDEFQCQQCGKCCLEYAYNLQVTEEDVRRWEEEDRWDILQWVSRIGVGECLALDFPIHPGTGDEVDRCLFLRKLPRKDAYICQIPRHETGCLQMFFVIQGESGTHRLSRGEGLIKFPDSELRRPGGASGFLTGIDSVPCRNRSDSLYETGISLYESQAGGAGIHQSGKARTIQVLV